MIVCVCRRVSDREIARHARAGMSFDDIQFELGVATQCGQCESCAREVHAQCACSGGVAALHCESGTVKENAEWPQSSSVAA
ncbi:(2Fe-2S)-binding protein [Ramlibacter sp. AN1133]|uniref:(2Fe-2S)-binding protein n=1 Tax=Ramlibacter sp. AN1133 TaxID=3133429 RepID=UPI0030BF40E4